MKSHKLLKAVLLAAALSVVASSVAVAEDGGFVRPGQTVSELRGKDAESPRSSARVSTWPEDWPNETARLLGLVAATIATLAALFLLWRRRRIRAGADAGGARLEILDRIALSTRQWVCILRVDEKRVVVGVSGDTMTSLAVLEGDPAHRSPRRRGGGSESGGRQSGGRQSGGQPDVEGRRLAETGRAGKSSGVGRATSSGEMIRRDESAFWFRPEGSSREGAPNDSGDDWENHLAPYRREVNRLRAMLQNWRQTTEPGGRAETDGGEGKGE